jgi:hypothetical protein
MNDPGSLHTRERSPWAAWLLVLLGAGLGLLWAVPHVRAYAHYPPDFDEAVHLLPTLQLANAARQGDIAAFWLHTVAQERLAAYPFIHSWLSFPAWLLAPSVTTMRLMSLVYLAGAAVLAFWIGHHLAGDGRYRWLSGLVAAALTLTSFPLWVYGSLAYLEGAGLLITWLALWLYGRSLQRPERSLPALVASLAVVAAFFTKYNFGLFLIGGIALNEVIEALRTRRLAWRRLLCLAGPATLLLLLWFADTARLQNFLVYGRSQQGNAYFWRLESWLYYPHSFIHHYLSSVVALALAGGGLLYALTHWRHPAWRAILTYLLVSLLMLLVVPQKEPRFLYTIAPAAFLPAGPFAAWMVGRLADGPPRLRRPALLTFALLAVWHAAAVYRHFTFFPHALEVAYDSAPETADAYRFITAHTLAQNQKLHMLNTWHLFNPLSLQWVYYADQGFPPVSLDYWGVTADLAPEPTAEQLAHLQDELRRQGSQALLSIDGSPAGVYTGWAVVEPLLAQGVLEPLASSPTYRLNRWSDSYRERVLAGDFADEAGLQAARATSRGDFDIQLHLYHVR